MMDQVDIEKEIIAVYNGLIWEARQNNREATENHKNRWRYPLRIKLNYAELKEQAVNKVLEVRDLLVAENKNIIKVQIIIKEIEIEKNLLKHLL